MNLPQISLPHIPIGIDIPHLIHPCIIHMVIALPIIILILEIINLFTKRKIVGVVSFFFISLLLFISLIAYLSGSADAKFAHDSLSSPVWNLIETHRLLAVYIIYITAILLIFKLLSGIFRNTAMKILMFFTLFILIIAIANSAKRGKSLVYDYGVNVKCVKTKAVDSIKSEDNTTQETKSDSNSSPQNIEVNTTTTKNNV